MALCVLRFLERSNSGARYTWRSVAHSTCRTSDPAGRGPEAQTCRHVCWVRAEGGVDPGSQLAFFATRSPLSSL